MRRIFSGLISLRYNVNDRSNFRNSNSPMYDVFLVTVLQRPADVANA
jgi:hypothetical protein